MDIELHTLPEFNGNCYIPLWVYSVNQANVLNANTGTYHTQSKTVGVKFPWLIDQVNDGMIVISHISTTDIIADGFTNPYGRLKQD